MEIIINVTQEQLDAVEAIVLSAQDWLQAAWDGKANACMERVINKETNLQGGKLSIADQEEQIRTLRPAKRRDIEENQ